MLKEGEKKKWFVAFILQWLQNLGLLVIHVFASISFSCVLISTINPVSTYTLVFVYPFLGNNILKTTEIEYIFVVTLI